jgi:hypothetical protein
MVQKLVFVVVQVVVLGKGMVFPFAPSIFYCENGVSKLMARMSVVSATEGCADGKTKRALVQVKSAVSDPFMEARAHRCFMECLKEA